MEHLRRIFDTQVGWLGAVIGDLGTDTAGDSTGLSGRAAVSEKLRAAEVEQGLPQPSGGRKEYKDDDGNVTKVVEWFGYKLHLLVDVKHEVALAYHVTDTKAGDNERIAELVDQARGNLPPERIKTLAYDKAADDGAVHELLHDGGIKPLIQNRNFKLEEPEKVVGGSTPLNIVYDQAGTVHCYDCTGEVPATASHGVHRLRARTRHTEVSLPGAARRVGLPQRRAVQWRAKLRPDGAGEAGDRPASLSEHPARPSSSSGCTKVARRSSGSTPG